jgi:hypothetical protein
MDQGPDTVLGLGCSLGAFFDALTPCQDIEEFVT